MNSRLKYLYFKDKNLLILLMVLGFFISTWAVFEAKIQKSKANLADAPIEEISENQLSLIQGNSLLPTLDPAPPAKIVKKMKVIVTGYSSSVYETDDDPYITAAGTLAREGIVANNYLPFGTKIRIPEIYGNKVFVIEDRMHWKKGNYHVDIWFPSYWQAKNFGAQRTQIEILEG